MEQIDTEAHLIKRVKFHLFRIWNQPCRKKFNQAIDCLEWTRFTEEHLFGGILTRVLNIVLTIYLNRAVSLLLVIWPLLQ